MPSCCVLVTLGCVDLLYDMFDSFDSPHPSAHTCRHRSPRSNLTSLTGGVRAIELTGVPRLMHNTGGLQHPSLVRRPCNACISRLPLPAWEACSARFLSQMASLHSLCQQAAQLLLRRSFTRRSSACPCILNRAGKGRRPTSAARLSRALNYHLTMHGVAPCRAHPANGFESCGLGRPSFIFCSVFYCCVENVYACAATQDCCLPIE